MSRTLLLLACVPVLGAQAPLTAHWQLDETMGTVAADSSGNGNDGTLVAFGPTPWTPGILGNALAFDGLNDYVSCPTNGGLPVYGGAGAPYSITAWVNAPAQNDTRIYSEGHSQSGTAGFSALLTLGSGSVLQDRLRAYIRNDNGFVYLTSESTAPVFDSTWHHVAWVDDGGTARLYVDGVLDATDFRYVTAGTFTMDRVSLGAVLRGTACCHLLGTLDDVRVYPFALTATDVAVVIGNGTLGTGFQTNQPAAALDVDGFVASPASAAAASVPLSQPFTLTLASDLPGLPWELAASQAPAAPNLLAGAQNVVNVDLTHPSTVLLNNVFSTPFGSPTGLPGFPPTSGTVASAITYTAPAAPAFLALQFAMIDPGSLDGVSLSGAGEVTFQ